GWAYDDRTEFFSRDQMVSLFSLARVNKAPASFDPKKLMAFQDYYMRDVPAGEKTALVIPYLQRAGLLPTPAPEAEAARGSEGVPGLRSPGWCSPGCACAAPVPGLAGAHPGLYFRRPPGSRPGGRQADSIKPRVSAASPGTRAERLRNPGDRPGDAHRHPLQG